MRAAFLKPLLFLAFACLNSLAAENRPKPDRNRPGPWDNDILIYRVGTNGSEKLATFPRAGVSTLARLKDGRLAAAHQHFPADNDADFDKVAVRFSSDEGRTWTAPETIRLEGLPEGMRFPFDPTLVSLADGRVRLYFTSLKGRRFEEHRPGIFSAVSSNAIDFVFEPGVRFAIEGRPVIDCAVALHRGVFHLFAPDNGTAINPGGPPRDPGERPSESAGYHATSRDGLNFTRQPDVKLKGARNWLGNAQSDGDVLRFFGTGGPRGVWTALSTNGESWTLDERFASVPGADPGAVKLKDSSWLLSVTGPPRNRPQAGGPPQLPPLMAAFDTNRDGEIDAREIEQAAASLRKLDQNGDGKLTPDELRPPPPNRR
jgi:hypothetical protein